MSAAQSQLFFTLLTVAAAAGTISVIAAAVAARAGSRRARHILDMLTPAALWMAAIVAIAATGGSLWFSEHVGYLPCKLCWYQRIAMYPLAIIAPIAAIRGDRNIRIYVTPVAAIGLCISVWHSIIEWRPALDNGSCSLVGPSCTDIWFRQWGVFTLATMAAVAFAAIIVAVNTGSRHTNRSDDQRDGDTASSAAT